MYRSILESFRLGDNKDVRWYVMGDDDSLFFVDNLVELLGKYDHNKYYYIGANSEAIRSNYDFSFDMGYGGAGYALSYSLIETLVPMMDSCIERYSYVWVSDQLSSFCLADIGVALTIAKGIHQSKTPPLFMFNARKLTDNPCEAPHVFFLDSIKQMEDNLVITTYNRTLPWNLQPCSASANYSADSITQIQVFLQSTKRKEAGRIECCDVEYVDGTNVADVKLRSCLIGELIA
ncbi:hypothetical protein CCACVL1_12252 [Corchorus capsularis]|uniref:Fringe-related protein n=1 Tax=Corchorus capsularis TaxID=210143 RepID=A0A1R3IGM5_COCAP|nr:hypothetical protein CCACVL1_12252 [Corchorus capsularis]